MPRFVQIPRGSQYHWHLIVITHVKYDLISCSSRSPMSIFVCRYAKIVVTYYECNYIDFKKKIL
jgi:hypothetical protein